MLRHRALTPYPADENPGKHRPMLAMSGSQGEAARYCRRLGIVLKPPIPQWRWTLEIVDYIGCPIRSGERARRWRNAIAPEIPSPIMPRPSRMGAAAAGKFHSCEHSTPAASLLDVIIVNTMGGTL